MPEKEPNPASKPMTDDNSTSGNLVQQLDLTLAATKSA
jgi:hypothetical protein